LTERLSILKGKPLYLISLFGLYLRLVLANLNTTLLLESFQSARRHIAITRMKSFLVVVPHVSGHIFASYAQAAFNAQSCFKLPKTRPTMALPQQALTSPILALIRKPLSNLPKRLLVYCEPKQLLKASLLDVCLKLRGTDQFWIQPNSQVHNQVIIYHALEEPTKNPIHL